MGFTESNDGSEARVYLVGIGNPIWFSRFVADFLILIVFYMVYRKRVSYFYVLCLLLGFSLLISSGSRGPILSLLMSIGLLIYGMYPAKRKWLWFMFLFIVVPLIPLVVKAVSEFNIYSLIARLEYIKRSIDFIVVNPLGYGFGSFGILVKGEEIRAYPHNIIFEIFVELGFLGLIVFLFLINRGFRSYFSDNLFFYLFVASLLNAQFSGDLASNAYLFLFLFLSINFSKARRSCGSLPLRYGKY